MNSNTYKGGTGDLEVLVSKARQGDKQAFCQLIREIKFSLYRTSRAILKTDSDCADAIQETILKAYESIGQLRKPGYFKTWITRILIHECYRIIEKRKKVISLDDAQIYLRSNHQEMEKIEIRELIDRLEEDQRIIITLYYFEQYSLKEIAELLEIRENTAKTRLHRARQALEKLFHGEKKEVQIHE
jgi:RNA polymerase sigma-70 factor (ECF subfamily)